MCITNDGSAGGTINDSGVTCDTASHEFAITENPATSYVFEIDGSTVCTNTTNLPTSGTNMYVVGQIRVLADVARNFNFGWSYVELDR